MMFVEFSLSKPWEFSENMLLIAAVMSSLIISQQVLKKSHVNPSGPSIRRHGVYRFLDLFLRERCLKC